MDSLRTGSLVVTALRVSALPATQVVNDPPIYRLPDELLAHILLLSLRRPRSALPAQYSAPAVPSPYHSPNYASDSSARSSSSSAPLSHPALYSPSPPALVCKRWRKLSPAFSAPRGLSSAQILRAASRLPHLTFLDLPRDALVDSAGSAGFAKTQDSVDSLFRGLPAVCPQIRSVRLAQWPTFRSAEERQHAEPSQAADRKPSADASPPVVVPEGLLHALCSFRALTHLRLVTSASSSSGNGATSAAVAAEEAAAAAFSAPLASCALLAADPPASPEQIPPPRKGSLGGDYNALIPRESIFPPPRPMMPPYLLQRSVSPHSDPRIPRLEVLHVSGPEHLSYFSPAFSLLACLRQLHVSNVSTLPESLSSLHQLSLLEIDAERDLQSIPDALFANLPSLQSLHLRGAAELLSLPESLGVLTSLKYLLIQSCGLEALPSTLGNLSRLASLVLVTCKQLLQLPLSTSGLHSLQRLRVSECPRLAPLPDCFQRMVTLKEVTVSGCDRIASLPSSLLSLSCIESLDLQFDHGQMFAGLPQNPDIRDGRGIGGRGIEGSNDDSSSSRSGSGSGGNSINRGSSSDGSTSSSGSSDGGGSSSSGNSSGNGASASGSSGSSGPGGSSSTAEQIMEATGEGISKPLTLLKYLKLSSTRTSLPPWLGYLPTLQHITLSSCWNLQHLPHSLPLLSHSLQSLRVHQCQSLTSLPEGFGQLTSLQQLEIRNCPALTHLPDSFPNLSSLRSLELFFCGNLTTLPRNFGQLTGLETLRLTCLYKLVELPESFGQLSQLRSVKIQGCPKLSSLPNSISDCKSLSHLHIMNCNTLSSLPPNLHSILSLHSLSLLSCPSLHSLPETLGLLPELAYLEICSCRSLVSLPPSLSLLSNLSSLKVAWCTKLSSLPTNIDHLSSLTSLSLIGLPSLPAPFPYPSASSGGLSQPQQQLQPSQEQQEQGQREQGQQQQQRWCNHPWKHLRGLRRFQQLLTSVRHRMPSSHSQKRRLLRLP